jgi:hypothetical protein
MKIKLDDTSDINKTRKKGSQFDTLFGRPAVSSEYYKRIAHVDGILVKHKRFIDTYDELSEVFFLSKECYTPEQLCILGPTGAGKTYLVEEFVDQHPRVNLDDRTVIPVLYVKVPPNAKSPKALASKILRNMGDPFFDSGTEGNMTQRIHNFVRECKIEMIILDEFQHLINRDTDHVLKTASEWLKTFIEEINIPVVLCGLPDSQRIFKHNEQLDSRYTNRIEYKPFCFATQDDQKEFRTFLKAIDQALPFANWSHLADPDTAAKIYYFSFGLPRYVMRLLKAASKLALKKGYDSIEMDQLRDGFNKITRSVRPYAINPFEIESFDLNLVIENEEAKSGRLFQNSNL